MIRLMATIRNQLTILCTTRVERIINQYPMPEGILEKQIGNFLQNDTYIWIKIDHVVQEV